jgi:thymidylate kinase
MMPFLIILRGPPGSGKTEVANCIMSHLKVKRKDALLDLDEVIDYKFNENISRVSKHDIIIGEMHYGDSHTTEPRKWIEKFEKKYKILSVVLSVGFEDCVKRAVGRNEHPLEIFDAIHQYFLFYAKYQNIFKSKAQVKEIQVNYKDRNPQQVAYEILHNPLLRDP